MIRDEDYIEELRRDPRSTDDLIACALDEETEEEGIWECIAVLHARGTREVLEAAQALARDEDPEARELAADILGQLGQPERAFPRECADTLMKMLLDEEDPAVLQSIAVGLGYIHDPRAVAPLLKLVDHEDSEVREGVAMGLLGYEDARAVNALIKMLADESEEVRNWAAYGLGSEIALDTPEIRDALMERLDDENGEVREEAMVGLAKRGDMRVIPAIQEELETTDELGIAVLEAAAELGSPELLPQLRALESEIRGDDLFETALADAIKRCGGDEDESS
ncbi:MAG: HEAT repeat domain-containing protein [Candidatus Hydrogenedentes bacterium]|nr:HEAT repeat domain-containing protein [Candidatus Hydrogenedentota bacterium]